MQFLFLLMIYLRSALMSLFRDRSGNLPEIVKLEEGFFHDLKGLYNKRLGLPINKFESGNYDERIIEDIRSGSTDVVKRFNEARRQFFELFAPDWELINLYREIHRLEKSLSHSDPAITIQVLRRVQERAFAFYKSRIIRSMFDLRDLLNQVVSNLKNSGTAASISVHLKLAISDDRSTFRLPYSDYSTWRRILSNVTINAIEAVEQTERGGTVSVRLDFTDKGKARITIVDDGVGMDDTTLENFAQRGFTKGKIQGQGLGISEDVIAFVNQRGRFDVESKLGQGTTVQMEIEIGKVVGACLEKSSLLRLSSRFVIGVIVISSIVIVSYLSLYLLSSEKSSGKPQEMIAKVGGWWDLADPDSTRSELISYHGITAYNHLGTILWRKTFRPYLVAGDEPSAQCNPILLNAAADGQDEIIVARRRSSMSFPGNCNILCLDARGDSLWGVPLGFNSDRPIFDYDSVGAEGKYTPITLWELPFSVGKPKQLLVVSAALTFPCQVLLVDASGLKSNEYWHPGHLRLVENEEFDYDKNGKKDLVFSGFNNRMGWATVLIITGRDKLSGQAPPWIDSLFHKAKEDCYFVFGHAWLNDTIGFITQGPSDAPVTSYCIPINNPSNPRRNNPYAKDILSLGFDDGRTVVLDSNLSVSRTTVDTVRFSAWWNLRRAVGFADRPWNKQDLEELKGYRKYIDGILVEDSIVLHPERYDPEYWARKLQYK